MSTTNQIYQYSVISALMTGLASPSSSTTLSRLLPHGTHGLGTFAHLDGELILLDSLAYQLRSDGSVASVSPDAKIPFAAVTRFEAQKCERRRLRDKEALGEVVEEMAGGARNLFVAVRVKGSFGFLRARTVPRQIYEGEPLGEEGKRQTVKEYHNVRGTIFGFRSPQWSDNVSVAGLHIHFLDDDKTFGGHVLAVEAKEEEVEVEVAVCNEVRIELPRSEEFGARELERDSEGLKEVEG